MQLDLFVKHTVDN